MGVVCEDKGKYFNSTFAMSALYVQKGRYDVRQRYFLYFTHTHM